MYFIPKNAKVLWSEEKWYDSLRGVLFYDWAMTHLKKISAGERENQTLKGCGFGLRLNLTDSLSARIEVGYPLGRSPSDGDNVHPWAEMVLRF